MELRARTHGPPKRGLSCALVMERDEVGELCRIRPRKMGQAIFKILCGVQNRTFSWKIQLNPTVVSGEIVNGWISKIIRGRGSF